VLFVDRAYFEGERDEEAEEELGVQAQALADYLGLPLYRARDVPLTSEEAQVREQD